MSDEISSVEHEGFTILSNTESAADMRSALNQEKPDPKGLKSDTETLDAAGKKHAGDGKFKGTVKPIKDAKEAKPAEKSGADAEKPPVAKQEPAQKETKAKGEEAPDAEEIARVKAEEEEKDSQRRQQASDRVRQATQRAAEDRRQREALAVENAQLKALLERGGKTAEPDPSRETRREPNAPQPPDVSKYETLADYLDARDDYNRKSWAHELEQKQRTYAAEARAKAEHEYISQAISVAEKALSEPGALEGVSEELLGLEPSFMAKARGERPGPWHALADEVIKAGKDGPALLRYLSEHQDELQHLDQLNPLQFQRKMGEITGRLQAATSAKPAKEAPFTPEPFKPVRAVTGQAQHVERDEDEMSMDFDTLAARRMRQGKVAPLRR